MPVDSIHSLINQNQQAGGITKALKGLKEAEEAGKPLTEAQKLLRNRLDTNAALKQSNGATLDVYNRAGEVVGKQTYKLGTLGKTVLPLSAKIGIGAAIVAALGIGGYLIKTKVIDKKAQEEPKKLDLAA